MQTKPAETESVCLNCKHFIESEGMFYCKFYDAFFNAETVYIPCEFNEESDPTVSSNDSNH